MGQPLCHNPHPAVSFYPKSRRRPGFQRISASFSNATFVQKNPHVPKNPKLFLTCLLCPSAEEAFLRVVCVRFYFSASDNFDSFGK